MTRWDPRRTPLGRFGPGNSGRPHGAGNRLGRKVRRKLEKAVDRDLDNLIKEVRNDDPTELLRLIIQAIPRPTHDVEQDHERELTDEEMERELEAIAAELVAQGYGSRPEGGQPSDRSAQPEGNPGEAGEPCPGAEGTQDSPDEPD